MHEKTIEFYDHVGSHFVIPLDTIVDVRNSPFEKKSTQVDVIYMYNEIELGFVVHKSGRRETSKDGVLAGTIVAKETSISGNIIYIQWDSSRKWSLYNAQRCIDEKICFYSSHGEDEEMPRKGESIWAYIERTNGFELVDLVAINGVHASVRLPASAVHYFYFTLETKDKKSKITFYDKDKKEQKIMYYIIGGHKKNNISTVKYLQYCLFK
jgi:hypothetical protein